MHVFPTGKYTKRLVIKAIADLYWLLKLYKSASIKQRLSRGKDIIGG
jgi:hypothetical protein